MLGQERGLAQGLVRPRVRVRVQPEVLAQS